MNYSHIFIIGLLISLAACSKDDSSPLYDLEQENFTNFQMNFNPVGGGDFIVFGFEDLGNIGIPKAAANGALKTNTIYDARALFFNRSVLPNKNLTESIKETGTDYQLFVSYSPDNVFQTIEYEDLDQNGKPLGLNISFETNERFVSGNLRFQLIRNPDKSVAYTLGNPAPSNIGGEVLIDANFEVIVQ
jgi:hypothetical protein